MTFTEALDYSRLPEELHCKFWLCFWDFSRFLAYLSLWERPPAGLDPIELAGVAHKIMLEE